MPTLRDYPYQVIAYLEDKPPSGEVLHCTIKRRFRLQQGITEEQLLNKLQQLARSHEITIRLGEKSSWDKDNTYYQLQDNPSIAELKGQIDSLISPDIEIRDPHRDRYDLLHVSFDSVSKKSKYVSGGEYSVVYLGLQVDYMDAPSKAIRI